MGGISIASRPDGEKNEQGPEGYAPNDPHVFSPLIVTSGGLERAVAVGLNGTANSGNL